MKRSKILMVLLVGIMLFAATATAFAATVEEQRQETRQKVAETLNKLYERKPSARTALKNAEGYAVFASSGIKLGILGASHGRGLAHNNKTGEEIFMRMKEYQAGLGIGAKEYALIFAFIDDTAWEEFTSSDWSFGGQADATADDGVNGSPRRDRVVLPQEERRRIAAVSQHERAPVRRQGRDSRRQEDEGCQLRMSHVFSFSQNLSPRA